MLAKAGAQVVFSIPSDHPALPGHFPGAPVVPGALLLAEGLQRLGAAVGAAIAWHRIDSAKFLRPVTAGTAITAALTVTDDERGRVEFSVAGQAVAQLIFAAGLPGGRTAGE